MRPPAHRLLRPEGGLFGAGLRFAISGVIVTAVYLSSTTFLAVVVGLPFQVALPLGYGLGLCVHFTLQRVFVWVHHEEFALPFHHQAARYLLLAGAQYGVTAASTALLPGLLGLPIEVVYLLTVLCVTAANFVVFRLVVFHAGASASASF
ncbi:MAG TPA: GtrA family protein [Solirubrobacteraceae bacterium]|nr:GtrA family protein [Solirubrobacteraceae bacterium]